MLAGACAGVARESVRLVVFEFKVILYPNKPLFS